MTEHCVNNGTSICQTVDATHLAVRYKDFTYDNTIGATYCGNRMELMFYFTTDFESYEDSLILCVTSMSDRTWHIMLYDNPYDNNSNSTLKALPAKETVELYTVRDFEFNKRDELIIFLRFGDENSQLLYKDIEQKEMVRLYKCLESLLGDEEFSDMTVQGKFPAHRAVVAAASKFLDEAVSNLQFNGNDAIIDSNEAPSGIVPVIKEQSKAYAENVEEQETKWHCLTNKTLDKTVSNLTINNRNGEASFATTGTDTEQHNAPDHESKLQFTSKSLDGALNTDLVLATTQKNEADAENTEKRVTELQSTSKSLDAATNTDVVLATAQKNEADDRICYDNISKDWQWQLQQLITVVSAFADSINMKTNDRSRLIKVLQNSFQAEETTSAEDDIYLKRPKCTNYVMDFTGLKPKVVNRFLKYIYTGDFDVTSLILSDISHLWTGITEYKIETLSYLLENDLIKLVYPFHNRYLTDLLHYSRQFKLQKLRSIVMKRVRTLAFRKYAAEVKDPFVHKCILSTPTHKYKTHGSVVITVPNISQFTDYRSKRFLFCNMPLCVRLEKQEIDSELGLSIYLYVDSSCRHNRTVMMIRFGFEVLTKSEDGPPNTCIFYGFTFRIFNRSSGWGLKRLLSWEQLMDPINGYVNNDSISVQVFVEVEDIWLDRY